jgi:hypothetical protein
LAIGGAMLRAALLITLLAPTLGVADVAGSLKRSQGLNDKLSRLIEAHGHQLPAHVHGRARALLEDHTQRTTRARSRRSARWRARRPSTRRS